MAKKISSKNAIYATLAAFIIGAFLLSAFLIYPTLRDIKNASHQIVSDREKTAFLYLQSQELSSFEKKLEAYQPEVAAIENLFIDPNNPVSFVNFVEQTASLLRLTIEIGLEEGAAKSAKGTSFSHFYINASGSLESMLQFSKSIEYGPYIVEVTKLALGSGDLESVVSANFFVQVANK